MGARPFGQRAATRSVADYAKDQIKQEGRWSDTELPRGPRSLNGASRTCSGIGPVGTKRQSEPSLPAWRQSYLPARIEHCHIRCACHCTRRSCALCSQTSYKCRWRRHIRMTLKSGKADAPLCVQTSDGLVSRGRAGAALI
jgi:hypothetical protein